MFESPLLKFFDEQRSPFPAPWFDYASTQFPTTHRDALSLCEFIVSSQPTYRAALDRIVSYFITEIEVTGGDQAARRNYKDYFENTLKIYDHLRSFGLDYLTYGNAFVSVITPVTKFAYCSKSDCSHVAPFLRVLDEPTYEAKWSKGKLTAKCPVCKTSGIWRVEEKILNKPSDLKLRRWSPHEIEIEYSPYNDECRYYWRIPGYLKTFIETGKPLVLATTPEAIIQACLNGENFRFNDSVIFHAKESTLAGINLFGWGISRILTQFRQAWLLTIYNRCNQAIALDYIMPLRIISPETKGPPLADPVMMSDMAALKQQLETAIHARRVDPTRWEFFPFPVRYQLIGAEGSNLIPVQLLEYTKADLLDSIGIPAELYRGTLAFVGAPVALRLFENCWSHLTKAFNTLLQWIADKLVSILGWDPIRVHLVRPSLYDDLNRQMARLQLMAGGLVSKTSGLKALGLDLQTELQQALEDEKLIAQKTKQTQEELQKTQAMEEMINMPPLPPTLEGMMGPAGAMPPSAAMAGGPPPASPPDVISSAMASLEMFKGSPQELEQVAQTWAQAIYAMPERRITLLRELQKRNPTIHALVKEYLRQMDSRAESEGRIMGRAMAAQQAASMGPQMPM